MQIIHVLDNSWEGHRAPLRAAEGQTGQRANPRSDGLLSLRSGLNPGKDVPDRRPHNPGRNI